MNKIRNDINGWLVVDKPYEMGSTDVVRQLKHLLHPMKIGHAGTLDPLATGVLPIALGKATRTVDFVMQGKKTYEFSLCFGAQTQTDDAEGNIIASSDKIPTIDEILAVLPQFTGDILQTPSAYSAIKIDGQPAYKRARKGQSVDMPARSVHIFDLRYTGQKNENTFTFEVDCGKGTYIRSLGRDMALALGSRGHLTRLRRTFCAPFCEKNALTLEKIKEICYNAGIESILVPLETVLGDIPDLAVGEEQARSLGLGQAINRPEFLLENDLKEGTLMKATFNKKLIAFVRVNGQKVQPVKVFNLIDKG